MRAVRWLFGCLSVGIGVGTLGLQACSSSDDGAADGADASEGGLRETSVVFDTGSAEPMCDPKADLFAKVKDAPIGGGTSTTLMCASCARAHCDEAIMNCTRDCACQRIVGNAIQCYLTTQQIGCAGELANYLVTPATRKYALEVLGCAQAECAVECAVDGGSTSEPDADAAGE